MSHEYWKMFWREHAQSTASAPAQCQVLRTLNKQPLSEEIFAKILYQIENALHLTRNDELVDLCCGNGAITTYLAQKCKSVLAIDYSPELLAQIDTAIHPNVSIREEDVDQAALPEGGFTKSLIYAGIQYFSEPKIVRLFCRVAKSLRPGGLLYVGDIPDADRLWNFFNNAERENTYFESLKLDRPIIGTWLRRDWLSKLGNYAGFTNARIVEYPEDFPYAHYRFDMVLTKS